MNIERMFYVFYSLAVAMNQELMKQAFSLAKTGKEFPLVVAKLKEAGVKSYEFIIENGVSIFDGIDGTTFTNPARFENPITSAEIFNKEQLKHDLKIHQQGETDFMTFVQQSADAGVVRWVTDMENMIVIYYGHDEDDTLIESIPEIVE